MTAERKPEDLAAVIDTIESGYEFLLAYAAQGRRSDQDAGGMEGPRARLLAMVDALSRLPSLANAKADSISPSAATEFGAFLAALERDAATAAAAIRLVLSQAHISSQIVDNLNASIHLRALLTDVFLIDEALAG